MKCPNCRKQNPPESRFCQHCGAALTEVSIAFQPESPAPFMERVATSPAVYDEPAPPPPLSRWQPGVSASEPQAMGQIGNDGTGLFDIWGPFAGYGTRGRHVSWLLDNLGPKAEALHEAITERFKQRQVPKAGGGWVTLSGKGLLVERRPFYMIRRGITTAALYVGRFGEDLYISQVTYVKGPLSNIRVLILALMLLFELFYVTSYSNALAGTISGFNPLFGGSGDVGPILFLACVIGPLGMLNTFLLGLAFIFGVYKWLKEKDFWALLRIPPNEFQQDDIMALEKAVEETVRQSLDKIGIENAFELLAPAQEYGVRPRII